MWELLALLALVLAGQNKSSTNVLTGQVPNNPFTPNSGNVNLNINGNDGGVTFVATITPVAMPVTVIPSSAPSNAETTANLNAARTAFENYFAQSNPAGNPQSYWDRLNWLADQLYSAQLIQSAGSPIGGETDYFDGSYPFGGTWTGSIAPVETPTFPGTVVNVRGQIVGPNDFPVSS